MDVIETKEYGHTPVTYGFLSADDVMNLDLTLDRSLVIISHVGDGEYSHNIFGNVFSSYTEALASYQRSYDEYAYHGKQDNLVCIILKTYLESGTVHYYVGYVRSDYKTVDKIYPQLVGYLTKERLNSKFNEGG